MPPGLREAKLEAVDHEAARERAGVEYIVGLIESSEAALRDAFVPEGTEEEQVGELLYAKVTQALEGLSAEYTRIVGVVVRHMLPDSGDDYPIVRLGWARFAPALPGIEDRPKDQTFPHILRPTEAGLDVINGLRTAQGYVTIQEQARLNHERHTRAWDAAIEASDREED